MQPGKLRGADLLFLLIGVLVIVALIIWASS